MKLILRFIGIIGLCYAQAALAQQEITIQGIFKDNTRYSSARLVSFSNMQEQEIAQASIQENGKFGLKLPENISAGVYRLYYSQVEENRYFDIIINGEKNISFSIAVGQNLSLPEFTASDENKAWYNYTNHAGKLNQKLYYLHQFVAFYPEKSDKVYKQTRKKLSLVQKELQKLTDAFINTNKGIIAASMVQNRPIRFTNPDTDLLAQQYALFDDFWIGIDTDSEILRNTPLYTDLIVEYLSLYMQVAQRYDDQELKTGFRKVVDAIVSHFDSNPQLRQQIIDYLSKGFKQLGQEDVLQYIDETYTAHCTNKDADFEKRMAGYNALRPGRPAPELNLAGLTLKDIPGEKLIVAFWAGWCPHCLEEMPKLNSGIAKYPQIGVAAISLDTEEESYRDNAIKLDNMMHFYDGKSWQGEAAEKFHVVATPTFFLLDKDRNIIDTFSAVEMIVKRLSEK